MICNKCHGTGHLPDAPTVECSPITIGHEVVDCYATLPHPGEPHMAILCEPCACCGGYDECDVSCCTYDAEPFRDPAQWWYSWQDGDLALRHVDDASGPLWRNRYQPSSPHARPVVAA